MEYKYTGFIPQNIAPIGAKKIGVYDSSGNRVCSIVLGTLERPRATKLYSFGLISDTHIQPSSLPSASMKLDNALTWFEEQGALFVCHTGDITNHGFWNSDGTKDLTQFADYQRVCELHPDLPVYEICGNHDSYFTAITENLTDLQTYTGNSLYYSVTKGNDVFVCIGQPSASVPMSDEAFTWLQSLLSANTDKRFFIFVHPYLDSGNAHDSYGNDFFAVWENTDEFKELLSNYNTLLFHGHSHIQFIHQETDKTANYANNGFHSIHVPSLMGYRQIVDGEQAVESLGYLVDVYENYIVLNARDFGTFSNDTMVNTEWVSIATYKIVTQ